MRSALLIGISLMVFCFSLGAAELGELAAHAPFHDLMSFNPGIECTAAIALPKPATERKTTDASFYGLVAIQTVATVADMETTFRAIRHGAKEGNPIQRPFVERGRGPAYAFNFGMNALLDWMAYKQKKAGQSNWYFLPATTIGSHTIGAGLNLRF